MTLRERIADWISGGALTRAVENSARIEEAANASNMRMSANCAGYMAVAHNALMDIASLETQSANVTARKMARIARMALK